MKIRYIAVAAVCAFAVIPATAQAQVAYTVTGSVTAACNATAGAIAFSTIGVATDGTLSDSRTGSSAAQASFYCNGAGTKITLAHAAMTNAVAAPSGFTNSIDFTPAVKVAGADKQVGDGANVAFGATAGSLVVEARNLSATGKLIAGSYSGSITLTLSPAN